MSERTPDSPPGLPRITGILYLVIIILGLFGELVVRGTLAVPGDPAATAARITEFELLFRLGFTGELIAFLSDVAVAVLLYVLLRPVGKTLSMAAAAFRLTGTAVYGVNLLNQMAVLLLLGGGGYGSSFGVGQIHALAGFFMDLHGLGYDLGLVFFGVHCVLLGYLLLRWAKAPGALGVLMVLAGMGYLVGSLTAFMFPAYSEAVAWVYAAPLIGELAFSVWLLAKGPNRGEAS
jgi:hypothetical protein